MTIAYICHIFIFSSFPLHPEAVSDSHFTIFLLTKPLIDHLGMNYHPSVECARFASNFFFAYKRNNAKLDQFHMCFACSL
jgi:hypothetical protein